VGARLIPNNVLWVARDYSATIRYSCDHGFLGVPVFASLQIWTREPTAPGSAKGRSLLRRAHALVPFSEAYLEFAWGEEHGGCDEMPRS